MPAIDPPAIEISYIGGPTAKVVADGLTLITGPTFDAVGREYPSGYVTLRKLASPSGWAHFTQSQQDIQTTFAVVGLSDRLIPVQPDVPIKISMGVAE